MQVANHHLEVSLHLILQDKVGGDSKYSGD